MRSFFFALGFLSLLSVLCGQNTIVVDPSGGTQFTTIASAIAAAQPGDTVRVLAGRYNEQLQTDKGIRLLGEGAVLTGGGLLSETVLVESIPVGQSFAMAGFVAGNIATRVRVRNCDGLVTLADFNQGGTFELFSVNVEGSQQVSLSSMLLLSAILTSSNVMLERMNFDPSISAGLTINSGRVACSNSTFRGSFSVFGGPGIILQDGDLALTRCSVRGVPSGGTITQPAIATLGGSVLLDPSTTTSIPLSSGPAIIAPWPITSQSAVDANNTLTVDVHGPVGTSYGIMLSVPGYGVTPYGDAWVQTLLPSFLDLGTFPASRTVQHSYPHPALPPGLVMTMQTLTWDGTALRFGVPSALVVR